MILRRPCVILVAMPGDAHTNHSQDARAVIELARELGATTDLNTLLERITATALRVLECDRATVFLYDGAHDELYSRVATGVEGLRFSARSGIAGQAVQTRRAIIVPDAYADPRFNRQIDEKTGYRTRNLLTLPLVGHDGKIVGVLQVLNKLCGDFTTADEATADVLSKLAGVAVQRQILLDEYNTKCRLERDLDLARQIQQRLLPRENPRVPGFDVAGWNRPADQTGGDCFDFLPMAGDRLGFLVADATGHGIGPALIIAQCRAMLRSVASIYDDLPGIATHVNRLLCQDIPEDRFVTACFGVLEPAANRVSYVSAGHGPILHYHAADGIAEELPPTGMPMGIITDHEFDAADPRTLDRGDILAVLTDGFVEWARPDDEQFGTQRVIQIFRDHPTMPAGELINVLYHEVVRFGEGTEQRDDLTAVIIKRM